MHLYLLTPSARHPNLAYLAANIAALRLADPAKRYRVTWMVDFQTPYRDVPIEAAYGYFDDMIKRVPDDGWVVLASDDNAINPMLGHKMAEITESNPEIRAVHFSQKHKLGVRTGIAECLIHGGVDGGQVVIRADYFRSHGWGYGHFGPFNWEGTLYQEMKKINPGAWLHCPEFVCYHDGQGESLQNP
jgi:hypothetical protein